MGNKVNGTPDISARVGEARDNLLAAEGHVDTDRLRFLLEAYAENAGQPPVIKRARLFHKICTQKPLFVDGNPIVGTLTQYEYGGYPIPEIGCRWMKRAKRFGLSRGDAPVSPEDREWISRAVDRWKDVNVFERTRKIFLETHGVDIGLLQKCGLGTVLTASRPIYVVPDYAKVLNKGLCGIIEEVKEQKAKLETGSIEDLDKWHFYQGVLICLDGMLELAQRYASRTRDMAAQEGDPQRRRELQEIAERCSHVPANPARSFYEALQSVWFTVLGVWTETLGSLSAPLGRFSQYMYPFFRRDKEEGRLTDEQAIELLQLFFLKINSLTVVQAPNAVAYNQSRLGSYITIGGLTADAEDATNELDWLLLEAQRRIKLPEPLIGLMYHNKLSEGFLLKCVELIRTGIGQPSFHDIEKAITRHLYHDKMPLEDARNVAIMACVQSVIPGCSAMPWEAFFNTAKMIELALNDGRDPLSGVQLGPATGDAASFASYADLHQAILAQMEYFIPLLRQIARTSWNIARDLPVPFQSALTDDCIKTGKDAVDGGTRYHVGNGTSMIGVVDLANSLAAIKKLVFDEGRITVEQLREALAADFDGFADIHQMCLDAPKYGNDDDYVDSIAKDLFEFCWHQHQRYPDFLGRPTKPEALSAAAHFGTGRFTGALPSGRRARVALTDGSVSAMPGTDTKGPTALAKSAAKVIDTVKYGSNHLNMKFHPTALQGAENARKLLSMIRTYFELGGYHVQFNCVSSETLRDAQLHPGEYRDLVVRVAGFSAFFVNLDPGVQNEVIKRTELRF